MKTFKIIDLWMSTGMYIILLVLNMIAFSGEVLIISYFIIGGWQLISMITHLLTGWFVSKGSRRNVYSWFSIIVVAAGIVMFLIRTEFTTGILFLILWF